MAGALIACVPTLLFYLLLGLLLGRFFMRGLLTGSLQQS